MGEIKIKNLSFTYPGEKKAAIDNISISIPAGGFVCLCGKSGCGKTTLLRLLKPCIAPFGDKKGEILFDGVPVESMNTKEQAAKIGFVMQNPDRQIVTDKVWHELAFGLESIGMKSAEIRVRVAEMAAFFGIESWFYKNTCDLSGGQKQILNLASVMAMRPSVLILDEPLSQLDPIAAGEFLNMLYKINRELCVTVILSEHRLEEALPMADKVIVLDKGGVYAEETPGKVGAFLKGHDMLRAMPTPMRVHSSVGADEICPVTLREGREWLLKMAEQGKVYKDTAFEDKKTAEGEVCVQIRGVYFSYGKEIPDVIRGLDLTVHRGEMYAILGGNGAGKSTTLAILSGLRKPYRGKVTVKEGKTALLPQNVQSVFTEKSVYADLESMLTGLSAEEKKAHIEKMAQLCEIEGLLWAHPFDLSGGEQQRAALAKVLLTRPQLLLLDEPTKGMDAAFKLQLAGILGELCRQGVTVITVSHDIEFCAGYADRCALFFDGKIAAEGTPRQLFCRNSFYTTSAAKMAGGIIENVLLPSDIIKAMGGKEQEPPKPEIKNMPPKEDKPEKRDKMSSKRIWGGAISGALFLLTAVLGYILKWGGSNIFKAVQIAEAALCFGICFGKREYKDTDYVKSKGNTKSMLTALAVMVALVPGTIYIGMRFFGDRKYLFISLLIILETLIPMALAFEGRRPGAREVVLISVLCAIAVAGRSAFFMLPQFKPVAAIVIITGICFGGETGFLVGAGAAFVSNFLFSQGSWAPWQMFAFGCMGFISGVIFNGVILPKNRVVLSIYGFIATLVIYGGIMNPASVIMWQTPTVEKIIASYGAGLPFDLIHGVATAFFMWFISEPMIEKIMRVRKKFGV